MARTPIRHTLEKFDVDKRETANGFIVSSRAIKADVMRELAKLDAEIRRRGDGFYIPV